MKCCQNLNSRKRMKQEKNKTVLHAQLLSSFQGFLVIVRLFLCPPRNLTSALAPVWLLKHSNQQQAARIVPGWETTHIYVKPNQVWDSREGAGATSPCPAPDLHVEQASPLHPELWSAPAAPAGGGPAVAAWGQPAEAVPARRWGQAWAHPSPGNRGGAAPCPSRRPSRRPSRPL